MIFSIENFDIVFDENTNQLVKFDLKSSEGEIISYKDMFLDYYDENYTVELKYSHFSNKMKLIFEEFINFLKIG